MKIDSIIPEFVNYIPRELKDGILYISDEYSIAAHNCACGCGEKVITPLSQAEWRVIKNGDLISLYPSIGNWNYKCKSHYWIRNNKIVWARKFTEEEIRIVQIRDAEDKSKQLERTNKSKTKISSTQADSMKASNTMKISSRIRLWFERLFT